MYACVFVCHTHARTIRIGLGSMHKCKRRRCTHSLIRTILTDLVYEKETRRDHER